jgi:ubiquinone/menaquinone biosynthesis C-methylase UbiE
LLFLRFAFRLLYYELAFTYDWVSWFVSMGQWRSWQRAALPHLRGQHILEIAHGLAQRIPLARGRVQALPFADHAFDSLLATFPTEFIVDPAAIAEFHRVLRPGGALVFVPAAQITGLGLNDRFADWLFRVTGQAAHDWYAPLLQRYAEHGFTAHIERVRLPRSVVTVVVVERSEVRSER